MTDQIEMTPEEGSQEESFASLFEQTTAASGFGKEGEIVKGRVIQMLVITWSSTSVVSPKA